MRSRRRVLHIGYTPAPMIPVVCVDQVSARPCKSVHCYISGKTQQIVSSRCAPLRLRDTSDLLQHFNSAFSRPLRPPRSTPARRGGFDAEPVLGRKPKPIRHLTESALENHTKMVCFRQSMVGFLRKPTISQVPEARLLGSRLARSGSPSRHGLLTRQRVATTHEPIKIRSIRLESS